MKKLINKVIAATLPLALAACSGNQNGSGFAGAAKFDKDGNEIKESVVVKKLNSVQDYLQYVDLERVYLSTDENGSPAMFLAVPSLETSYSGQKKEAGIGYYFKGTSGLGLQKYSYTDTESLTYRLYKPWNDATVAKTGTTGYFGFPCLSDENGEVLHPLTQALIRPGSVKMDVAAINQKALAAIDAIAAIPESQRTEEQKEKILQLTDEDMVILFGSVKKSLTAEEQVKADKARIAISKLHVMMNGFRMTVVPRGGIQSNCQSVTDDNGNAVGLMALDYLLPAAGFEGMDREFYVNFRNAVEKEVVVDGIKRTIIVHADNQDLEVKADDVVLMTDAGPEEEVVKMDIRQNGFVWTKRADSTFHNSEILINLYTDAGYAYKKATSIELTAADAFPPSQEFCGLVKKVEDGAFSLVHQDEDYSKTVNIRIQSDNGTFPLYFSQAPSKETLDNVAKAKCGCIKGVDGDYSNYNVEPYISFNYLFHVDTTGFTALEDKQCSKFKDIP